MKKTTIPTQKRLILKGIFTCSLLAMAPALLMAQYSKTFTYDSAMQEWKVPPGVLKLSIQASGGQGGGYGGLGASFTGVCNVTPGHTLTVIVAGQGGTTIQGNGNGGGGASFVYDSNTTNLYVAAAGGGGVPFAGYPGGAGGTDLINNTGTLGSGADGNAADGTGGNGGAGGTGGDGPSGGGAGWIGNGGNASGTYYSYGGNDRVNNFVGGAAFTDFGYDVNWGGYGGGGGAAYDGGGGGGGYNGGGGGNDDFGDNGNGGDGGGSYLKGKIYGSAAANNYGDGRVVISYLGVNFSKSNATCHGSNTGMISVTPSAGKVPYAYAWSNGKTTSTISGLSAGTYTLIVKDSINETDSLAINITQPTALTLSPKASLATICAGDSTMISTTAGGGIPPYSYAWSTGATTSSITVAPGITITYSVTVTDSNSCSYDSTVTITVNPLPALTLSGNTSICGKGNNTNLSVAGGTAYTWSTGATTSSITVSPDSTLTYTVDVSNGTCSKDTSITVIVNSLPQVSLNAVKDSVCVNWTKDSLIGMPSGGTYSGTGVTGKNFNPSVAGVGTHSIIYSYTDSAGCSNADTIKLIVNACTGIQEVNGLDNEVTFYPNPFTQSINVNINLNEPVTITMFNMLGENVGTWQMEQGQHSISTQSLPAGVYTMQVKTSNGIMNKKLIKVN